MLAAIFSRNILDRWRKASLHEQDDATFDMRFKSAIREEERVKTFKAFGTDKDGKKKPPDQPSRLPPPTRKFFGSQSTSSHFASQPTARPSPADGRSSLSVNPAPISSSNRTEPRRNAQGQLQCYKDGCRDTDGNPGFHTRITDCPDPARPHNQSTTRQANAQAVTVDRQIVSQLSTKEMLLYSSAMLFESRDLFTPRPFIDVLMGPEGLKSPPLTVNALVDSGCSSSLISFDLCTKYLKAFAGVINAHDVLVDTRLEVRGVSGTPLIVDVALRVPLQFNAYRSECLLYVLREANHPFLLGTDVFPALGGLNNLLGGVQFASIMGPDRPLAIPESQVAEARTLLHRAWEALDDKGAAHMLQQGASSPPTAGIDNACAVTLFRPQVLYAGRTAVISVALDDTLPLQRDEVTYFHPDASFFQQTGLDCPDAIISPKEGKATLFVQNWLPKPVILDAGQLLGTVEPAVVLQFSHNDGALRSETSFVASNGPVNKPYMNGGWRMYDNAYPPQSQERTDKLHQLVGLNNPNLSVDERRQVRELLTEYADVFALTDDERGENDWYQFVIDTGDASPINQPFRRVPLNKRHIIETETTRMLGLGLIEPSTSSWSSPVNIVTKKDSKPRFVCDFRRVNSVTKKIASKLPRMDDLIDQMSGAQFLSSMDMVMGFWQTVLDPATADRSAFATHQGNFQHRVLPQGLTNSPAQFSRVVATVFSGLNTLEDSFIGYYLDDICVYSRDFASHLRHLNLVFDRLRKACLLLKARKCEFMQEEIEFLGYRVGRHGVRPIPAKLQGILDYPTPKTVKDVQSFLGMSAWYRKWIRSFASIAAPLYQLTRKGQPFVWGLGQQSAFETLKEHLTSPPILRLPDMSRGWVVETDASDHGIGATLSQPYDDGLHLVQCVSRALNDAEFRYSATEKETLAVVYACKAFRPYLLHSPAIEVITDHKSTGAMLLGGGDLAPKHYRWLQALAELNPKIRYRAGPLNVVADALSRHPSAPATDDEGNEALPADPAAMFTNLQLVDGEVANAFVVASEIEQITEESLRNRAKQLDDPVLSELITLLERGIQPQSDNARTIVKNHGASLQIEDGVLFFSDDDQDVPDGLRLAVPETLRRPLFDECHAGLFAGHLNERRIWGTMKRYWWWPKMRPDIRTWTNGCMRCAKNNPGCPRVPPLTPIAVGGPMELVSVDVLQLPSTISQNRYAVVYIDHLTKWPEVYAVADQTAETLARTFTDFVSRHSAPTNLLSDQGSPFTSATFQKVTQLVGTKQTTSTAHHHNTVGQCERFNNTLMNMLRKSGERFPDMWDSKLSNTLFAFRASPSASTGYTPFELLYGRQARLPTQHALNRPSLITDLDVSDYATVLSAGLSEAWRNAKLHIDASQHTQKLQYDKHAKEPTICPGDRVFLLNPDLSRGPNHKLLFSWEGPMKVVDVTSTNNVLVKHFKYPLLPAQEVAMERLVKARAELPNIDPEEHARRRRRPPQLHNQFPSPEVHQHEHTHSTRSKSTVSNAQSFQATVGDHTLLASLEKATLAHGAPPSPDARPQFGLALPSIGSIGGNAEDSARATLRYTPLPDYLTAGQSYCYMFQITGDSTIPRHYSLASDSSAMAAQRESLEERIRRELHGEPEGQSIQQPNLTTVVEDAHKLSLDEQLVHTDNMEVNADEGLSKPAVPIIGALTAQGVFIATNVFVRRCLYGDNSASAQRVRTNYKPDHAVITGLPSHPSNLCQTAFCSARQLRGDGHFYCKPTNLSDIFASHGDQRIAQRIADNPRIANGAVGSIMDLRHYGPLLLKATDAADQLVLDMLECPTSAARIALYWARVPEVMGGDALPPLTPLHKLVQNMVIALTDNCRIFTAALESTAHLPIFDVTSSPDQNQLAHHELMSLTEGHEVTRRNAYASALEHAHYNAWLRPQYPILADGMVHVVGGASAQMFSSSISPETRRVTTMDCSDTANFHWVNSRLAQTTLSSTVTHLVICIDLPTAINDTGTAEQFAAAYAALNIPDYYSTALHIVVMGPLPRPGFEVLTRTVNTHLAQLAVDRGVVIADYPSLLLGANMFDRSAWDVQNGHINFIGGYKVAAQLQQAGVPWIAMPIDSFLAQASQMAAPSVRPNLKRPVANCSYTVPKRNRTAPPFDLSRGYQRADVHQRSFAAYNVRPGHEPRFGGGADHGRAASARRRPDHEPRSGGGTERSPASSMDRPAGHEPRRSSGTGRTSPSRSSSRPSKDGQRSPSRTRHR